MSSDYLMRQIEDMSRFLASVIFGRQPADTSIIEEDGGVSAGNLLRLGLHTRLKQGDINGAENLLFDTIKDDPRHEYIPAALDFYEALGAMSDAELLSKGFSRAEVAEGLRAVTALYAAHGTPITPEE